MGKAGGAGGQYTGQLRLRGISSFFFCFCFCLLSLFLFVTDRPEVVGNDPSKAILFRIISSDGGSRHSTRK